MVIYFAKRRACVSLKLVAVIVALALLISGCATRIPQKPTVKSGSVLPFMPEPTELLSTSIHGDIPTLKGIRFYKDDPLRFDFIIHEGDEWFDEKEFEKQSRCVIKYFLASLTIPEDDLWVNLSPFEKERIIPDDLGFTEMGRDLLGEDYVLKQLLASLTYPESPLGKKFWSRVYERAFHLFGTVNIPINTFNRIWIVPDKAVVYEDNDKVFLGEAKLKVLMEQDYFALRENKNNPGLKIENVELKEAEDINNFTSQVMRDMVLPIIEEEVNYGENFALLRQIYRSLVLASWFKQKLKKHILERVYVDKKKIKGVDVDDTTIKEKIYQQYVEAYKKGVYNYIKSEDDIATNKQVKRRYYSGGCDWTGVMDNIAASPITNDFVQSLVDSPLRTTTIKLFPFGSEGPIGAGVNRRLDGTGSDGFGVAAGERELAQALPKPKVELERRDTSSPLQEFTQDELRLIAAMVTMMRGNENEAAAILSGNRGVQINNADFGFYLRQRKLYQQNRRDSDFYRARRRLLDIFSSDTTVLNGMFGQNRDSAMNSLALKGDGMLAQHLGVSDYLDLVITPQPGFNESLVSDLQEYVALTDVPDEQGKINVDRLQALVAAVEESVRNGNMHLEDLWQYLSMVLYIKQEQNIEIVGFIEPEYFKRVTDILRWFPKRLANQIRVPIQINFEPLDSALGLVTGAHTIANVKIDHLRHDDYNRLEHTVWHELMHKYSQSSDKEGNPILPVATWKFIAKKAGFYGALIDGKLVPVDELTNNYKDFRTIYYDQWIYQEADGSLRCYVSREMFDQLQGDFRRGREYSENGIVVETYRSGDYWKTAPFEAVAEAGAYYIENSIAADDMPLPFNNVVAVLAYTIFTQEFDDGALRRYQFFGSYDRGRKVTIELTENEIKLRQRLYRGRSAGYTAEEVLGQFVADAWIALRKVAIKDGYSSGIEEGSLKEGVLLGALRVGNRIVLRQLHNDAGFRTTTIRDIRVKDSDNLILEVHTETSVYEVQLMNLSEQGFAGQGYEPFAASSPITQDAPAIGTPFKTLHQIVEEVPSIILDKLKTAGASSNELANMQSILDTVHAVYSDMGLLDEHYHNHAHNLAAAFAMLALTENDPDITFHDRKIALIAGLFHDFHVRIKEDAEGKGTPALVAETVNELKDLFGLGSYGAAVIDNARYGELSSVYKERLSTALKTFFAGDNLEQIFNEVMTLILRTDFASDVAPAPDAYYQMAQGVRSDMQIFLEQTGPLRIKRVIAIVESSYGDIFDQIDADDNLAPDAKDVARAWVQRQKGIEIAYLESLNTVTRSRQKKIHALSVQLEKGADQAGLYWMGEPAMVEREVVAGLAKEIPIVTVEGTYPFFFRKEFLRPDVIGILKDIPFEYKQNFNSVMEYFVYKTTEAGIKMPDEVPVKDLFIASQSHWQENVAAISEQLGLEAGMFASSPLEEREITAQTETFTSSPMIKPTSQYITDYRMRLEARVRRNAAYVDKIKDRLDVTEERKNIAQALLEDSQNKEQEGKERIAKLETATTAQEFIEVLKSFPGVVSDLTSQQKRAIEIVQETLVSHETITFDPNQVFVIPDSSWLYEFFDRVPDFHATILGVSDASDTVSNVILIRSQNKDLLPMAKRLLHELVHTTFVQARGVILDEKPELFGLYRIFEEAMTDRLALDLLTQIALQDSEARQEGRALIEIAKTVDEEMFAALNEEEAMRLTFDLNFKTYMLEDDFLAHFLEAIEQVSTFSSDQLIQHIENFLLKADTQGLQALLGDSFAEITALTEEMGYYSEMPQYELGLFMIPAAVRNSNPQEKLRIAHALLTTMKQNNDEFFDRLDEIFETYLTQEEVQHFYQDVVGRSRFHAALRLYNRVLSDDSMTLASAKELFEKDFFPMTLELVNDWVKKNKPNASSPITEQTETLVLTHAESELKQQAQQLIENSNIPKEGDYCEWVSRTCLPDLDAAVKGANAQEFLANLEMLLVLIENKVNSILERSNPSLDETQSKALIQHVFGVNADEVTRIETREGGSEAVGAKLGFLVQGYVVRVYNTFPELQMKKKLLGDSEANFVSLINDNRLTVQIVDVVGQPMDIVERVISLNEAKAEAENAGDQELLMLFEEAKRANPLNVMVEFDDKNLGLAVREHYGQKQIYVVVYDLEGISQFIKANGNAAFTERIANAQPVALSYERVVQTVSALRRLGSNFAPPSVESAASPIQPKQAAESFFDAVNNLKENALLDKDATSFMAEELVNILELGTDTKVASKSEAQLLQEIIADTSETTLASHIKEFRQAYTGNVLKLRRFALNAYRILNARRDEFTESEQEVVEHVIARVQQLATASFVSGTERGGASPLRQESEDLGGIALDGKLINMEVRGEGLRVPLGGVPFDVKAFEGFSFQIIKIEKIEDIESIFNEELLASL